jgi:hypothetical protein
MDDLVRLKKAEDKVRTGYKLHQDSRKQQWDAIITTGEGLYEVKESIGRDWYSWINKKVPMPRDKAIRFLGIYETYCEGLVDYNDFEKMSDRMIDTALAKVKESNHDKSKPVKPLDIENKTVLMSVSLPKLIHGKFKRFCHMQETSMQNYTIGLIEKCLIEAYDKDDGGLGGAGGEGHDNTSNSPNITGVTSAKFQ